MTLSELESLAQAGKLKREPATQGEFDGLLRSGEARLGDAGNTELALESRFDLAYNASHALALAALRWYGFRSESRYIVFQSLPHTLGLGPEIWRVLDKAHHLRNLAEYEGYLDVDERLLADLLASIGVLYERLCELGPLPPSES